MNLKSSSSRSNSHNFSSQVSQLPSTVARPKKPTPKTRFHAGGAWKVAYGDFVTGMMALFLVLWITTMKTDEVFATTRYFKDSYLFGYTPSDPIKQPESRTGSIVNQIIGYEESVLPNEEQPRDTIQYKVLEQMAMEFYKLLNMESDPNETSENQD